MRRDCFAAVMLAAAPPNSPCRRSRTSTKTRISPSRAMRSTSPQRRRQLRSTMTTPRCARNFAANASACAPSAARKEAGFLRGGLVMMGVHGGRAGDGATRSAVCRGLDLAVAKLKQYAFTDELVRCVERQMPYGAIELDLVRCA